MHTDTKRREDMGGEDGATDYIIELSYGIHYFRNVSILQFNNSGPRNLNI